jgi:hypothetical protein
VGGGLDELLGGLLQKFTLSHWFSTVVLLFPPDFIRVAAVETSPKDCEAVAARAAVEAARRAMVMASITLWLAYQPGSAANSDSDSDVP